MNWSPVIAVEPSGPGGSRKTVIARTIAKKKRIGIPIFASFSIPAEIPRETTRRLIPSVTAKKTNGVHGPCTAPRPRLERLEVSDHRLLCAMAPIILRKEKKV